MYYAYIYLIFHMRVHVYMHMYIYMWVIFLLVSYAVCVCMGMYRCSSLMPEQWDKKQSKYLSNAHPSQEQTSPDKPYINKVS